MTVQSEQTVIFLKLNWKYLFWQKWNRFIWKLNWIQTRTGNISITSKTVHTGRPMYCATHISISH